MITAPDPRASSSCRKAEGRSRQARAICSSGSRFRRARPTSRRARRKSTGGRAHVDNAQADGHAADDARSSTASPRRKSSRTPSATSPRRRPRSPRPEPARRRAVLAVAHRSSARRLPASSPSARTTRATWSKRPRRTSSCAWSIPIEAAGRRGGADSRSRARAGRQTGAHARPGRRRAGDGQSADPSRRRRSDGRRRPTCASRSTRRPSSPSARRCASRSSPSSIPTRSRVPVDAIIHEDERRVRDGRRRRQEGAQARR